MTTQEIGQGNRSAAGDLGGAEALLHEGEGGLGEGSQSAFGVVEKSGAELVRESVNAVGGRGLLTHEATTTAVEFAQVMVDGVRIIRISASPSLRLSVSPVRRARRASRVLAMPSRSRGSVLAMRFSRFSLASYALTRTTR